MVITYLIKRLEDRVIIVLEPFDKFRNKLVPSSMSVSIRATKTSAKADFFVDPKQSEALRQDSNGNTVYARRSECRVSAS